MCLLFIGAGHRLIISVTLDLFRDNMWMGNQLRNLGKRKTTPCFEPRLCKLGRHEESHGERISKLHEIAVAGAR